MVSRSPASARRIRLGGSDFDLADRALELQRRQVRQLIRLTPREQLIEQDSEAVDVARGRDCRAPDLLGLALRGVSSRASAIVRFAVGLPSAPSSSFAMPKSRSFGAPSAVTRMFDALMSRCTMRCWCADLHRSAHLHEEPQASCGRELMLVAVRIDRQPLDVLHDQVWQPLLGRAAIEQLRDVRMIETWRGSAVRRGTCGAHRPKRAGCSAP